MSMTYHDVIQRLLRRPEIDLLEILEISSEDIINMFGDKIEEKLEDLIYEFEDEQEELYDSMGIDIDE